MVAVVVEGGVKHPVHPDGDKWLVVWVEPNGRAVFADSISEIVAELVPGYADLDDEVEDDSHLESRVATLAHLAARAQAAVLAEEGPSAFSEDELTAMLTPKDEAAPLTHWNPAAPLVLLTTSYKPFTDAEQPVGAVIWLDPVSETTLLSSLQSLGYGELWVAGV